MQTINVRETRERLSQLLDAVASGEEIVILRHGKPAARLTGAQAEPVCFLDRSEFRRSLPPAKESAAVAVSLLRDDARY
jgi:prevent-host-death family protein